MKQTLEDICAKLQEGIYYNEEHVRVCIVLRLLQELGWDIWNPTEVNTEFKAIRTEDSTRVDVALFCNQFSPSVFIEVKAVGRVEGDLQRIEQQLRDYNRNNTAEFSIITDGQKWRFYYSQTGGEFSNKCFKDFDVLTEELDDSILLLEAFLSKTEILNGNATKEATNYLRLGQRQRAMEDALPKAKRLSQEPPFPRLPEALVALLLQAGITITEQEAEAFITDSFQRRPQMDMSPKAQIEQEPKVRTYHPGRGGSGLPPNGTKCRFKYAGQTYYGIIEDNNLVIQNYGKFSALSRASGQITDTSRNGWKDWELQLPGSADWVLAQTWRDKQRDTI